MKNISQMRSDALEIFQAGVRSVAPGYAIRKYCHIENGCMFIDDEAYDLANFQNIYVIGAGKATAPMAAAAEKILGDRVTDGVVTVKYGHVDQLNKIRLREAGHPVPDEQGLHGANEILKLSKQAGEKDLVICLISGGGSALLPYPVEGITLKEKQDTIKVLLTCGATIHEINTLRKHISKIKGGRLAQAVYPANLVTFILSDVVGDDLDVIASGTTVPDTSTFDDCMRILKKYNIEKKMPENVVQYIINGIAESRVIMAMSRCLMWDSSCPSTARNSSRFNRLRMPRVTQTRPSPCVRPKAKALGIASWEMPTLGLGRLASLASSATIRCISGSSFSETHFIRIVRPTIAGPIRYWKPRITKAMIM